MAKTETKQTIAVRFKLHEKEASTALIKVDSASLNDENRAWDACEDALVELLDESPKWHRILGTVTIKPLRYE